MIVDRVLAKLAEIERAVGSETAARVRGMVMDAEDAVLEVQRETLRLMRELEVARSRRVELPAWQTANGQANGEMRPLATEPERPRVARIRRLLSGRAAPNPESGIRIRKPMRPELVSAEAPGLSLEREESTG
jgi:hypothetical protein